VGLGTWKIPNSSCAETVYTAIKAGYRLFDGACDYGNEKELGEGVRRALDEGIVKREELFITSKLWNTFHSKEHVRNAAKMQLRQWGLEYFDLFLVHFPIALEYVEPSQKYPPAWWGIDGKSVNLERTPFQETWVEMEKLVDEGIAKNIGVSNTAGSLLCDIFRYARIEPQVLQVEIHPYLTQKPLIKLAKNLGMAVTAYSSFGPQGYLELEMHLGVTSLLTHDVITRAASNVNKTPGQVILRWAVQQGLAVIPKSTVLELLVEDLSIEDFELSEADMKAISGLNAKYRMNDPAEIDPRLAIFA